MANGTTRADELTLVPTGEWDVDPERTTVGFEVRHLMVTKVHGHFNDVAGTISCDADGRATVVGAVTVASIDTADPRRDERLRAEDFFDAERHPQITVSAVSAPVRAGVTPIVRGSVTVRGASCPFELRVDGPARALDADGALRIRASGAVSRRELGLEWDSAFAAGGLVINDRVALRLDVVITPRPRPG